MADPQPPTQYVMDDHLPDLSDAIDAYKTSGDDVNKATATERTTAWLKAYCDWVDNGGGDEAIRVFREDLKQAER